MKWDETTKFKDGTRVRRAYFQDHVSAQELIDWNGKAMDLREVGSGKGKNGNLAEATRQAGGGWSVKMANGDKHLTKTKDEAIDIMLGRN